VAGARARALGQDDARVGLLAALAGRLNDAIMLI
jgi:hypothetical protein